VVINEVIVTLEVKQLLARIWYAEGNWPGLGLDGQLPEDFWVREVSCYDGDLSIIITRLDNTD